MSSYISYVFKYLFQPDQLPAELELTANGTSSLALNTSDEATLAAAAATTSGATQAAIIETERRRSARCMSMFNRLLLQVQQQQQLNQNQNQNRTSDATSAAGSYLFRMQPTSNNISSSAAATFGAGSNKTRSIGEWEQLLRPHLQQALNTAARVASSASSIWPPARWSASSPTSGSGSTASPSPRAAAWLTAYNASNPSNDTITAANLSYSIRNSAEFANELLECFNQLQLRDYYAGYDIFIGLRIASTLTILFIVFLLFVVHKTGCRSGENGANGSRSQLQLASSYSSSSSKSHQKHHHNHHHHHQHQHHQQYPLIMSSSASYVLKQPHRPKSSVASKSTAASLRVVPGRAEPTATKLNYGNNQCTSAPSLDQQCSAAGQ